MKKKNYLLITICVCLCVWSSCKKSESSNDQKIDIGYWHNEALGLYAKNGLVMTNGAMPTHDQFRERVLQVLVKNDPSLFNEQKIRETFDKFDNLPLAVQINASIRNGKIIDQFIPIITYLNNSKEISNELAVDLEKIHTLTINGTANKTILQAVNDLKSKDFSDNDQKYINAFVDVFNASNKFWMKSSTVRTTLLSQRKMIVAPGDDGGDKGCNQMIILADAAGAAYGMLLGPFGSIMEAAIFSLLASINPPCEPS